MIPIRNDCAGMYCTCTVLYVIEVLANHDPSIVEHVVEI
jgi:hypothetical protein